ncbi:MAG: CoA-binding protein [bacterium]
MEDSRLKEILETCRVIAVVGLSPKQDRPSYRVASYLQAQGYKIVPVNPGVQEILGEKAYASLLDIPEDIKVDIVDVFRRPQDVPPIAQETIERGAKVLWLQEGIVNEEAAQRAMEAGISVVQDRCMLKEHRRLLNP